MGDSLGPLALLEQRITEEPALAVYFSSHGCQVCHALFPRIEQMLQQEYPAISLLRLKLDEMPELGAQMGVLSVPTLIIYLDHREAYRYVRQISVDGLRQDLARPYALLFG